MWRPWSRSRGGKRPLPRQTLQRAVEARGIGLHSGATIRLRLEPAEPGSGVRFERRDLPGSSPIPADWTLVTATERRTELTGAGSRVATVEHLLAAVYALEVDDLTIGLDGPEVPLFDGAYTPFVELLDAAGRLVQPGSRRRLTLPQGFDVSDGDSTYRVEPAEVLTLSARLEYTEAVIGWQSAEVVLTAENFRREIAAARTYGFRREVEPLQARGLLAGATTDSAILLEPDRVVNTTLRWQNEFARHKLGDLIGDLALLGARPAVRISARRPSHRGNLACVRAIARAARDLENDG